MTDTQINEREHREFDKRLAALEERMAKHDTQYAVINTKLSAILWGIGVLGTAVIGVLVKFVLRA